MPTAGLHKMPLPSSRNGTTSAAVLLSLVLSASGAQAGPDPGMRAPPPALRVLVFWDKQCRYCVPVLKQLQRVRDKHARLPVRFCVVGTDSAAQAAAYLGRHGLRFETLQDDGTLMLRYGVVALPWVVITDDAGKLLAAPPDDARASQVSAYLDMELYFRGR